MSNLTFDFSPKQEPEKKEEPAAPEAAASAPAPAPEVLAKPTAPEPVPTPAPAAKVPLMDMVAKAASSWAERYGSSSEKAPVREADAPAAKGGRKAGKRAVSKPTRSLDMGAELEAEAEQGDEEAEEQPITVGQLTQSIKVMLEEGIGSVWVRGEISNWKPAASGHIYFSLKDSEAMISAAFFRGAAQRSKLAGVRDGTEVICRGRISVYPPRGSYQIIVESLEPVGAGSLQAQFEALKKKLFAEGLFDSERKRPIPLMPERIVVITSPTGAAIRDVLSVLKRRFAGVQVLVIPCLVQGTEAAGDLVRALRLANEHKLGDVILLTRGGGSLEDLWSFNDENLAREIYNSMIPVVSAVGHEVDFSIADFVADLRAATPSAAAELLVREKQGLHEAVNDLQLRLVKSMRHDLRQACLRLQSVTAQLKNPRDRINDLRLRFDDWSERLSAAATRSLEQRREGVRRAESSLRALSPLRVLERGYAIAFHADGTAVRWAAQLPAGAAFSLRLADGTVAAEAKGPRASERAEG